jgi:hypothetical protein
VPTTAIALVIAVVAVLPGAAYSWAFEREAGAYGAGLADRTLRFLAASVVFHALLAWPEYLLWRVAVAGHRSLDAGQFAVLWAGGVVLVAVPYGLGRLLGRVYRQSEEADSPAPGAAAAVMAAVVGPERVPTAWDAVFARRQATYLRALLADGSWVAGVFGSESYAGGYPAAADLYLEMAWGLDPVTKALTEPLGYSLYLPASHIVCLDLIPPVRLPEPA